MKVKQPELNTLALDTLYQGTEREEVIATTLEEACPVLARNYRALLRLRGRGAANAYLWIEFYFLLKDEAPGLIQTTEH